MSQPTKQLVATFRKIINFHNAHIIVYSYQGVDYIPAKSVTDIAGIDWRNTKKSILEGDNQHLYGSVRISMPKIDNLGGDITPQGSQNNDDSVGASTEIIRNNLLMDVLCIRLDRVQMFLARVNTSRMRSHGNVEAADYLLSLQTEWAQALHSYETHGIAIKSTLFNNTKQLKLLSDIYRSLNDKQQKHVVSQQIDACLGITRTEEKDLLTGL